MRRRIIDAHQTLRTAVLLAVRVSSRGSGGHGESSYPPSPPPPGVIPFTNNSRIAMLPVFYLAIPEGYILGSSAKEAAGDWHWALRVSPVLGITAGALILLFVPEPKRGSADQMAGRIKTRTSWFCDMKALAKNRSYVFSSLASAAVSFATGAFGMWIPLYLARAQVVQKTAEPCTKEICSSTD
ncbi:protein spinster homolog 2, partial [Lates japonicus]